MLKKIVAVSLLGMDYGRLNDHIKELEPLTDWFQVDVMDGNFVPNLSMGALVMKCLKTEKPFDCHLMITHPDRYIKEYADAGAYSITIHAEASTDLKRDIDLIKSFGCKAAVALSPETPVSAIKSILPKLDMVLVMTVKPGFGGQKFMEDMMPKVREIRENYPELNIQVDGGINAETAPIALKAGANILAIGSYITAAPNPAAAMQKIKDLFTHSFH
ncbi:ribulose-phosphate 3-epimerase [Candidatus Peregrinibacteria bacterium]|nr:MAG: ribulose-phosphate 3-epimerase [Candidatus Peregrinibacteria bacterium]